MAGWYIRRGEKIVGPVDAAKLTELVRAGRLLPTDQLAKEIIIGIAAALIYSSLHQTR